MGSLFNWKMGLTVTVGTIMFIGGFGLLFGIRPLVDHVILSKLPVLPGSDSLETYQAIPFPIYTSFYFFNVTNPDDFLANKSKPILQEVGPYVYTTTWTKEDIAWHENDTFSFREIKTYVFNQSLSSGSDSDIIVSINVPLATASYQLKDLSPLEMILLNIFLDVVEEKPFVARTVDELIFNGYEDKLILLGKILNPDMPGKFGMFSFLAGQNASSNDINNVYTGKNHLDLLNVYSRYDGKNLLNFYSDDTCNMINGTNGQLRPPFEYDPEKYDIFVIDFCRSYRLTHTESGSVGKLQSERFIAGPEIVKNGADYKPNECFDSDMKLPSGAYDVSKCRYNSPIVMSYPHFLHGDKYYHDSVEGLAPNEKRHQTYVDIQPKLGLTLDVRIRLQANVNIKKVPKMKYYEDINELVFPVFWEELNITATDSYTDDLYSQMNTPITYAVVVSGLLIAIGGGMTIGTGVLYAVRRRNAKRYRPLPDDQGNAE